LLSPVYAKSGCGEKGEAMSDISDLELVLKAHFPLIIVATHEENRAVALFKNVAAKLDLALSRWSVTDGLQGIQGEVGYNPDTLRLVDDDRPASISTRDSEVALRSIRDNQRPGIFLLLDFHPFLEEPVNVRLIKEVAQDHAVRNQKLIFISHAITLPDELSRFCAPFSLELPGSDKLRQIVLDEAKIWAMKHNGNKLKADKESVDALVRNLSGLTLTDATRLIRNAIYNDGAITASDVPQVAKAKHGLIGQDGVLCFEYDTASLSEVGGFAKLKAWLNLRREHFLSGGEPGVDTPKGILLLGVQGGGKSLAAKAVAGVWQVPLLRLDFGALYNKFFGETERNMREALSTAELVAPCVLWCDEIEKGISTGDYDSGTSQRVLATLLTWMAENKKPVFIVATANDISTLPPELIRKGRLDEIFFVDLPGNDVRKDIFSIHLRKRRFDPERFDLETLCSVSEEFSGAEIEQSIVAAVFSAKAQNTPLNTSHIVSEILNTKPLSVVMAEDLQSLRQWASARTVAVD
jgi:hypothetical protein